MNRLATILLVGGSAERSDALSAAFHAHDIAVTRCVNAAALIEEAHLGQPDMAVIDLAGDAVDGYRILDDLAPVRAQNGMTMVLIGADGTPETYARALAGGADEIFTEPFDSDEMLLRLVPLFRLATLRRELSLRQELARRFGLAIDNAGGAGEAPVKFLQVGRDAGEVKSLRATFGPSASITSTPNIPGAQAILGGGTFFDACFMALPAGGDAHAEAERGDIMDLCSQIRINPRLFNLPVVVLAPPGTIDDIPAAIRAGATRILERPAAADTLHAVLDILARRQQSRWRIRRQMGGTRGLGTTDPRTGAYTFDFMRAHLETLIEAARIRVKHLSLIFFSFPDADAVAEQFGEDAGNHLLRQLHQWIDAMVRVEDMTAHYSGYDFCVALPDTPVEEARFVMNRIGGVLTYTDFALVEVYQPVSISVEFGLAANQPGDTAEALIQHARSFLD